MASTRRAGRSSGIPLYQQIFLTLRDEITSGKRPIGSAVPTEHEVAVQFDVSRITARRALDELAAKGLVERKRRVGTRVIFQEQTVPIEANIDQAVESLIAFGRRTRVRVVSFEREIASPEIAELLDLSDGTMVVRALRVRFLDDLPLGAIESFVPEQVAGALNGRDLMTTPLLELIRTSGHTIGAASQTVSAVAADPALAAFLQVEPRAPIIRIDRLVRGRDDKPLLATIAQYRGDRYRLTVDLGARAATD
ncbi:GntR family transcriptional regulator [Sphingobium sp.]|uniref:GntR family transcriptional regulator n=1 Tax=Sphingobium sp. TaxID=1912891 RepID=UPI002B82307B|nr:GntR family transcriptional regulator [Sphingobium sp.]HUD95527.1 GntR family transcriptional regulator [Sphingobium sp.]